MKKRLLQQLLVALALLVAPCIQIVVAQSVPQFFGVAHSGGTSNDGTVFKINTDGSDLTVLHNFNGLSDADGRMPSGSLLQAPDGSFLGVTAAGGLTAYGTLYKINGDGSGFQILHHFSGPTGAAPYGSPIRGSDGSLFGMTYIGGTGGFYGTIYKLSADGVSYTVLHNFDGIHGGNPYGSLIQASDGALYGMTSGGGASGGNIFKVNTDGSGYTVLHTFSGGAYASLIQGLDGALYGMTTAGGSTGGGTIFKINTNGSGYTVLHSFTNATGISPQGSLTQAPDGTLFGTTYGGGSSALGTLFKINADGSSYTVLHHFNTPTGSRPLASDLTLYMNAAYGYTTFGGLYNGGVIFKYDLTTSTYSVLADLSMATGQIAQHGALLLVSPVSAPTVPASNIAFSNVSTHGMTVSFTPGNGEKRVVLMEEFTSPGGSVSISDGAELSGNADFSLATEYQPGWRVVYAGNGSSVNVTGLKEGTEYRTTVIEYNGAGTTTKYLNTAAPAANQFTLDIPSPTVATSNITFSDVSFTSMHVNFTPGNGQQRLAVMKAGSAPAFQPVNNMTYSGDLGNGETVVYAGSGNTFDLSGLQPGITYFIKLFEFNTEGNVVRYLVANAPVASMSTRGTMPQLFGMTFYGGSYGAGTIFKFNADEGDHFAVRYNFKQQPGGNPRGSLMQASNGSLYGTTTIGGPFGASGYGTIFKIEPNGTGHTVLHNFTYAEGAYPYGGLVQTPGGSLLGMTVFGGSSEAGTIYKINPDGTGYTVVHHFSEPTGRFPFGHLILASDGALYGMAEAGGSFGVGTIFKIQADGSGFTVLHSFEDANGSYPLGSLIQGSDGALYGTTGGCRSMNCGTIFKINTNGTGFTVLHYYPNAVGGASPTASLVQGSDGTLFGTTSASGTAGLGTIFKLNPDGSGYATLHNFSGLDGSSPTGGLVRHDHTLFGFTNKGGQYDGGVLFKYDLTVNAYSKLTDLNDATGKEPWYGNLLLINVPPIIEDLYVINPANNAVNIILNPNVTSNEVPMAETYTIELNTDPAFGAATALVNTGGRTLPFSNLAMNTTYYSRVKTNLSPLWGDMRQFKTGDALALSFVASPGNNTTNVSWTPTVILNTVPGATTYTVQLCASSDFASSPLFTKTGNTTTFNFTGLEQNTKYYSHVTTNLTPDDWGPVRSFTTGTTASLAYVINPGNNNTGVTSPLTITSNTVPGASQYTIQLSETANFAVIAFEVTGASSTLAFSGLKYNTTYYNRVRTNLSVDYGPVRSFTTRSAASRAFVVYPADHATGISNASVNITSNSVPGASSYTIQLSETADFSSIAFEVTGPTRVLTFTGLNLNTLYYNRVRTDLAPEYGEVHSFTTRSFSSVTYVSSPANNASNVKSPVLDIIANTVPGASSYTIQLSESVDFSSIAFEVTSASQTLAFAGLKYNTTYYNRVRTNLAPEFGPVRNFTTRTAESISYVIAPYINAVNVSTSPSITSNTVPAASTYTIQLSEYLDFSTVAFEATGSTSTLAFGGLKFNTVYYNRVRTNLSTEFGEVRSFTTRPPASSMRAASARLETPDQEIASKEFDVNVYPNPFRETLIFSVESSVHDKAGIKLVDMNGKIVHESIEKTNSTIEIKKPFANSVYLLRVNAGAFSKVVRVVRAE